MSEWVAAVLKLASSLCAVVAAGLFVLALRHGEGVAPPGATEAPDSSDEPVLIVEAGEPARDESAEKATQESRSEFQGAILSLESRPSGASAQVNGVDQGETPVSVGLDCVPGTPLVIEFTLRDFQKETHKTLCPMNAVVTVKARMRKDTGSRSGKR
ncbi:PEGA domain-containing protein [Melittangium boletus]|uniref:PEGA domain-containing protein n=1 Tax=Melittangium boletus DSM 14713 TaxID=1294270 RepID=A0A250IS66_9BACT|nr:PEGA domain-containing protein [Melittangium boletus]ATB34589.1 PEGA domain-containing protein [Melittangium boletus DSM 14713]